MGVSFALSRKCNFEELLAIKDRFRARPYVLPQPCMSSVKSKLSQAKKKKIYSNN